MKRLKMEKMKDCPELTFYTYLWRESTSYETFREYAGRRMKVLRQIKETVPDVRHFNIETRDEDILSHFFCRIICSHVPWATAWFINAETTLFRLRVSDSISEAKIFFLREILPHMRGAYISDGSLILDTESEYDPDVDEFSWHPEILVHFTKLCDMIGKRLVIPVRGYVKFNESCIKSLLVNEFRRYLERRMCVLAEISRVDPDERMQKLCIDLLANPIKTNVVTKFSLLNAQKYFPLCMQAVMRKIKTNRHLKYNDRQMLCLFLKDCGMTVDESVDFFRSSFKVSREVFDKEYLYSIRHNYGLEGKRANYTCFSCSKISKTIDEEGKSSCPFVGSVECVRDSLEVECVDIEDVFSRNIFNLRCTKFLEKLTHGVQEKVVATPVRYYFEYKKSDAVTDCEKEEI